VAADAEIAKQTSNQTLYQAMMDKAKVDLENRLTSVKLPLVIAGSLGVPPGPYPLAVIAYGSNYPSAYTGDLSDWAIKDVPGGTTVYAYSVGTVVLWSAPGAASDSGATEAQLTIRVQIAGLSLNTTSIRAKFIGNTAFGPTVIENAYIGERSGATRNVVPGTLAQFLFSGSPDLSIPMGGEIYSDWLTFNIDMTKQYFISSATSDTPGPNRRFALTGSDYYRNGDFSATEYWGTSGAALGNSRNFYSLEIFDPTTGTGWDGDAQLTRNINDWSAMGPMITSRPYGTTAMIAALNSTKTKITARQGQIAARNPALPHFQTYEVAASASGPGTVTPSGSVMIEYGTDQIFTFTPTGLAVVNYVIVDGANIGSPPSYTFTNVQTEHSIAVYFV
jgi:hypothetical protein